MLEMSALKTKSSSDPFQLVSYQIFVLLHHHCNTAVPLQTKALFEDACTDSLVLSCSRYYYNIIFVVHCCTYSLQVLHRNFSSLINFIVNYQVKFVCLL